MQPSREQLVKLCREVLAPLVACGMIVASAAAVMYLVSYTEGDVHIHLAGTCGGCPGVAMTRDRVLEPALRSLPGKVKLRLTAGWRIPPGSEKLES